MTYVSFPDEGSAFVFEVRAGAPHVLARVGQPRSHGMLFNAVGFCEL
jgi:hypothetical protein